MIKTKKNKLKRLLEKNRWFFFCLSTLKFLFNKMSVSWLPSNVMIVLKKAICQFNPFRKLRHPLNFRGIPFRESELGQVGELATRAGSRFFEAQSRRTNFARNGFVFPVLYFVEALLSLSHLQHQKLIVMIEIGMEMRELERQNKCA